MAQEKTRLALYINHGKKFQLRDVYYKGQNPEWESGPAGIVVEGSNDRSGFPPETTKKELDSQGFVIV